MAYPVRPWSLATTCFGFYPELIIPWFSSVTFTCLFLPLSSLFVFVTQESPFYYLKFSYVFQKRYRILPGVLGWKGTYVISICCITSIFLIWFFLKIRRATTKLLKTIWKLGILKLCVFFYSTNILLKHLLWVRYWAIKDKMWSLSQIAFGLEGGSEIREQMAALLSAFMGGSTELEANS